MTQRTSHYPRLDYDPLAGQFDQRYRANPLSGVEQTLVDLSQTLGSERILEVGCGTGRWLKGLAARDSKCQLYGLDASQGMLKIARNGTHPLQLLQGRAGQLPFTTQSFGLIFCVNALHHFAEPDSFIQQTQQILKPGGVLAVIGQVPQDRRNRWYVYDFFAGTYEQDLRRFPTWGVVTEWMIAAGFEQIHWQPVEQISDDKIGQAVLDDPFLQKKAVSQLALLSEEAYAAGIAKIKQAIRQAEANQEIIKFETQLRLDLLTGTRP